MFGTPQPFRIQPNLPVEAYQTYQIDSPADTMVRAACEEVVCTAYLYGWETKVDESTDLGRRQADYIRKRAGRTFKELRDGAITVFRFESGQRCFSNHQTRPESYMVTPGDWRGQTGPTRHHATPADWVDDFGSHQDQLVDQIKKG